MAKKIEWSETSIHDRFRVYYFWLQKNKTNLYSEKLELLFNEAARLISEFPEIGTETDFPNLRVKVVKNHKLFYLNQTDTIQILGVWDTRQNPEDLKLP